MRVLFTTIPSSGHFHPLVPFAMVAREAGHEVAFACAEFLRPAVCELGFPILAAGLNPDGDGDPEFDRLKQRARRLRPGSEMDRLGVVDVIFGVRARRMLPELIAVCRDWSPDVIVRECFEAAGAIAGDRLGIPHASVEIMPLFDLRPMRDSIEEQLDRARADIGLAPDPGMLHRYLSLCFAPPVLLDPAAPRPATLRAFRPSFFDRSGREGLPGWISRLPGRPTVYVTFGTVATAWRPDAPELLRKILDGLAAEPLNVVVTVGRRCDPEALGPPPANARVEPYIPQSLLLPHCDVCLSHAGFNTVLAAIDAGLPQVFVPLLADNPHNAHRCAELGLGRVVPPNELTPEAVRDAVRSVLHDPRYRSSVRRLRREMRELPGLEEAVALLEQLAAEGEPLPATDRALRSAQN